MIRKIIVNKLPQAITTYQGSGAGAGLGARAGVGPGTPLGTVGVAVGPVGGESWRAPAIVTSPEGPYTATPRILPSLLP